MEVKKIPIDLPRSSKSLLINIMFATNTLMLGISAPQFWQKMGNCTLLGSGNPAGTFDWHTQVIVTRSE